MEELNEVIPSAEAPGVIYQRHLQNGKLGYQRCADCSAAVFYPRALCPVCGSGALEVEIGARVRFEVRQGEEDELVAVFVREES